MKRQWLANVVIAIAILIVVFSNVHHASALVKTYDSDTNIVTIGNGWDLPLLGRVGIPTWLGGGGTTSIADLKLTSPHNNLVPAGKDVIVATFTINNYGDYDNPFDGLEFYDANTMQPITRDFKYKYAVYRGNYTQYGKQKNDDGSSTDISYEVENYTWEDLDTSNLPQGTYTVALVTDVKEGDYVEWIPTLYGERIDEWASFTGVVLRENYGGPFDNNWRSWGATAWGQSFLIGTVSTNETFVAKGISLYLSKIGVPPSTSNFTVYIENTNSSGAGNGVKIGYGSFDASVITTTDYVNPQQLNVTFITEPTFAKGGQYFFYINNSAASVSNTVYMSSKDAASSYAGGNIYQSSSNPRVWDGSNAGDFGFIIWKDTSAAPADPIQINASIIFPLNNTNFSTSLIKFNTNATISNANFTNATIYIWNGGLYTNSTIVTGDSTYNSTNITYVLNDGMYNWSVLYCGTNSSSTFCNFAQNNYTFTIDTLAPTLSIIYPTAGNYNYNVSQLNYTVGNGHLQSCWYSTNATNTTIACGTNATNLISVEGLNEWRMYANDSFGNINYTNVTFNKDTVIPLINFTYPTPPNNTITTSTSLFINVSASDTNLVNITQYLYNSAMVKVGENTNYTSTNVYHEYYGLADGTYYYNGTACDSYNNCNSTNLWKETIDTFAPLLSIVYPINQTNFTTNTIGINYTISDSGIGLSSCWYNNGTGLTTLTNCGTNITFTANQGWNTIQVYGNDSINNINSSIVSFFVDSVVPLINFTYPTEKNNSNWNIRDWVYMNTSWTEVNFKSIMFELTGPTTSAVTYNVPTYEHNFTSLADGTYYYNVTICDMLNNCNTTGTWTLSLDTIAPSLTIVYPLNTTYNTNVSELNYTLFDAHSTSCWYTTNHTITTFIQDIYDWGKANTWKGKTTSNATGGGLIYHSAPGNCDLNISYDVVANYNGTIPQISFQAYADGPDSMRDYVEFNYSDGSAAEVDVTGPTGGSLGYNVLNPYPLKNVVALGICGYQASQHISNINFSIYSQGQAITCGTNATNLISEEGSNTWTVQASDNFGNVNISSVTFFKDTIVPLIKITYPTNTSYVVNVSQLNYTLSDLNLDTCWYSLDNGLTNTTITCGNNVSGMTAPIGSSKWTVWTKDITGNINSSSIIFSKTNIIQNKVTYNNNTYIGNLETFILNATIDNNIVSAYMNYNGTLSPSTISEYGLDHIITNHLSIPVNYSNSNATFYWFLTGIDGQTYNSSSYTQDVSTIGVDDCSVNTVVVLNLTSYDEDTKLFLNETIEGVITLYPLGTHTNYIVNYSNKSTEGNLKFCLPEGVINTSSYSMYYESKYYDNSSLYAIEYKYGQMITITNNSVPLQVSLYGLKASESTEFNINYRDANLLPVNGAIVDILREYIPENQFTSVETPQTDVNGRAIAHLIASNQKYTIIVSKDGVILGTFDNVIAKCNSAVDCRVDLNSVLTTIEATDWEHYGNVSTSFLYDNNTNNLQLLFTTTDAQMKTIGLNVMANDQYGNNTICNVSVSAQSGVLLCNIPSFYLNTSVIATPIVNGFWLSSYILSLGPDANSIYGGTRIILGMLMYSTLALLFMPNPLAMVIGGILGLIFAGLFMLVNNGSLYGTGATILFFVVAGVIVLYQISKRMNQ